MPVDGFNKCKLLFIHGICAFGGNIDGRCTKKITFVTVCPGGEQAHEPAVSPAVSPNLK